MSTGTIERRSVPGPVGLSSRSGIADAPGGRLTGYAAIFDAIADIGGLFRERIAPGAFRQALRRGDDTRATFNHDPNLVLGRVKAGTLTLTEDAKGLRYSIALPSWAGYIAESVARGDVTQSSFAFMPTDESWDYTTGHKLPLRTIHEVRLVDVSPVTYPAYESTIVSTDAREAARQPIDSPDGRITRDWDAFEGLWLLNDDIERFRRITGER